MTRSLVLMVLAAAAAGCGSPGGAGSGATGSGPVTGSAGSGSAGSGSAGLGTAGSGSAGSGTAGSAAAGSGPVAPPVKVDVGLDTTRAASRLVPTTGGTVSATGADGTTYDLVIPPGALLEATTITLTPVLTLRGVPVISADQTPAGVQMAPDGLTFYESATLIIKSASGLLPPVAEQLFVQWEGDGERLGLAPPDPTSEAIRLHVLHFSGMAVLRSKGVDADLTKLREQLGGTIDEHVTKVIAAYLTRKRAGLLKNGEVDVLEDVLYGDLGRQFVAEVLEPRFAAAGTSCPAGQLALETAVRYAKTYQLVGATGGWFERAIEILPTVAEVCMKEEFEICRDEHVTGRIMRMRLRIEQQRGYLGVDLPYPNTAKLDDYAKACLKFELDVDSRAKMTTTVKGPTGAATLIIEQAMRARDVALALQGTYEEWIKPTITGTGLFVSVDYSTFHSHCSGSVMPMDSPLTVANLKLKFDDAGELTKDFMLVYVPEPNMSSVQHTCEEGPPVTFPFNHQTIDSEILDTTNPYNTTEGGHVLEKWSVTPKQEEMGRKVVKTTLADTSNPSFATVNEKDETFVLRHVPSLGQ